jgi:hypothetical protein
MAGLKTKILVGKDVLKWGIEEDGEHVYVMD